MPRSDAIPLTQLQPQPQPQPQPTQQTQQPQPGGRASAIPLNQSAAAPAAATGQPPAATATPTPMNPQGDAGLWGPEHPILNLINNAGRAIDAYNPLAFGFGDWARASLPSVAQYKATGDIIPAHGPLSYLKPPPGIAEVVKQQITGAQPPDYLDQLRAQTAGAHAALGPVADIGLGVGTNLVGGMALPALASDAVKSALANSPRLAKLAGWGAGVATSGAQNAVESGLSTIGQGGSAQDALKSAEWGGGLGAALGTLGVGSAKGAPAGDIRARSTVLPSDPTAADLAATSKQAYTTKAGNVLYNNADVRQAMTNAISEINQSPQRVARYGKGALDQIDTIVKDSLGRGTQSAEDLNDYIKQLHVTQTGDNVPEAGMIAQKHLNLILGQGLPISGQPLGAGAEAIVNAKQAFQRSQNASMLEDWRAPPPGSGGTGEVAPSGAQSALKANPSYYSDPDVNAAMEGVARAGQSMPSYYLLKHALGYPVAGAIAGGVHGYATAGQGESPWTRAGEEAAAVGGGSLLASLLASQGTKVLARRAMARGTPTLIQGAPYAPTTPLRDAFQALLMGQSAKGTGY